MGKKSQWVFLLLLRFVTDDIGSETIICWINNKYKNHFQTEAHFYLIDKYVGTDA